MWKIIQAKATNICSFEELDYTLNQNVMTLIFGENLDNDSQKSNGSGKSTLLEVIALGLIGGPLRKVKTEEIINDMSDEATVQLILKNQSSKRTMEISRQLSRKSSSSVSVTLRDDVQNEAIPFVFSSVDETNKQILLELGLSKDEILNYFILSKHRYQSFLNSSDKDKKEIINRFSNGIVIDDAIALLQDDIIPVQDELHRLEMNKSRISGAIDSTKTQIEELNKKSIENNQTKKQKIESYKESIASLRSQIRGLKQEVSGNKQLLDEMIVALKLDKNVSDFSAIYRTPEKFIEILNDKLKKSNLRQLPDYSSVLSKRERINQLQESLSTKDKELESATREIDQSRLKLQEKEEEYKKIKNLSEEQKAKIDQQIEAIQKTIDDNDAQVDNLLKQQRSFSKSISDIKAKLAGTIECPACHHKFLLFDKEFDAKQAEKTIDSLQSQIQSLESQSEKIDAETNKIEANLVTYSGKKREIDADVNRLYSQVSSLQEEVNMKSRSLNNLKNEMENISSSIASATKQLDSLFDTIIDDYNQIIERESDLINEKIKRDSRNIEYNEGEIESLQESIKRLEQTKDDDTILSLEEYLKKYDEELKDVEKGMLDKQAELGKLQEQERLFIEFKTYLANTKIADLSAMTNSFLEHIGSDIRIKFSGYTYLKSGKIRDKISISLIRAGLDCGSFFKFSEGEKARVNLASILAMQKLTNLTAETDKGLDLLVLDEILEAADEEGLANMFQTINKMNITALAVSQGKVAENYPYKLLISKHNGKSQIKNAN